METSISIVTVGAQQCIPCRCYRTGTGRQQTAPVAVTVGITIVGRLDAVVYHAVTVVIGAVTDLEDSRMQRRRRIITLTRLI